MSKEKTELRAPLCDHLESPLTEAAVQRMWRGIGEKRARAARPVFRIAALGLAFAGAAIVIALFVLRPRGGWTDARSAAGPLTLAGGAEIGLLEAIPGAPPPPLFELSDGSTIELAPGTRIEALESTDRAFAALLSEGRAVFHVLAGGPRRWSIECGLATVEVVGTRFVIERGPARVRVEVLEGVVLVRGERVPDRVKRLAAGERMDIDGAKGAKAESSEGNGEAEPEAPAARETEAMRPKPPTIKQPQAAPPSSFRDLARRGDYKAAYSALGPEGFKREAMGGDVDALLLLADIARLSGHAGEASAPLSRIVTHHASDPRAALAAFTLGRLELDSLGQPARAAGSFQRALDLGLSEPLIEDALARLVEARARASDPDGARAAAADYERRFPSGRRLEDVRRWAFGK
jgi:transmembrane sensor